MAEAAVKQAGKHAALAAVVAIVFFKGSRVHLWAGYAVEFRAIFENDVRSIPSYGRVNLRAESRGSCQAPLPATRPTAIIS